MLNHQEQRVVTSSKASSLRQIKEAVGENGEGEPSISQASNSPEQERNLKTSNQNLDILCEDSQVEVDLDLSNFGALGNGQGPTGSNVTNRLHINVQDLS